MGFLDSLLGRSRPKQANLDNLFLLPNAATTMVTALGLSPTGTGSVCYRASTGAGFAQTQTDVVDLLETSSDAPAVSTSTDGFGFTWLEVRDDPEDLDGVVAGLHAVNTTLELNGYGPSLLCTLVPFAGAAGADGSPAPRVGLVYLYKQGTFYPFAPTGPDGRRRDNLLEIQVRDALSGELPIETDLSRWLAVWGAPGL